MLKFLREKKGPTVLLILVVSITFFSLRAKLNRMIPQLVHLGAILNTDHGQPGNHQITPADNLFLQELRKYITAPHMPDDKALIRAFTRTNFRQDAYGVILTA